MGRFVYGARANSIDIDDRTLAHLRIVIMNKLRRSESFMFDVPVTGAGETRSFWIHPTIPVEFHFFGSRSPHINRAWVEELMAAASSANGLTITAEPPEPVTPPRRTGG